MKQTIVAVAAFAAWAVPAAASEVPPVSVADFVGGAVSGAHPLWLILAGEGIWGAIVVGVAGFVYRFLRPFIVEWAEERKLSKLYLSVEACVAGNNARYVEGMKAANSDGRLTKDEAAYVFSLCRANLVEFMRTQGVDVMKEYGGAFVDGLIELLVSRMKNPVSKAVAAPLPGSPSAPLPELDPAEPVRTGAVSG